MSGRRVRRVAKVLGTMVVTATVRRARREARAVPPLKRVWLQVLLKKARFRALEMRPVDRRTETQVEARAAPVPKKGVSPVRVKVPPVAATRVAKAVRLTASASRPPVRCVPQACPTKMFFPMSPRRLSMPTTARRAAYAHPCCAAEAASPMPRPSACCLLTTTIRNCIKCWPKPVWVRVAKWKS